jgi:hypothetical protein
MERSDLNAFSFVRDRLFFLPRWQLLAAGASRTLDWVYTLHSTGVVPRLEDLQSSNIPFVSLLAVITVTNIGSAAINQSNKRLLVSSNADGTKQCTRQSHECLLRRRIERQKYSKSTRHEKSESAADSG